MKVGLIIDDHMGRPGGVQEYVRGLYHYLVDQGHEAVIFAGGGGQGEERIIPLGRSLAFRGSGSSSSFPLTLHSPIALRRLLQAERCDVLHVMAPYSPTLSGRLLVQETGRPIVRVMTLLVALEPHWWAQLLGVAARFQWRSLRRFDARLALSPLAAETGQALYGDTYHIIPCGVDIRAFRPDVAPIPALRDERVNLLYVGRLEARKGVAYLLQSYALLQRQFSNLRLIIGGDGPERIVLQQLARKLQLRQVEFLGYVPAADLPRLLVSGDIFCAPATHAESFGIVLIEAMAAGLPIVAAGNRGYRDLLQAHLGNLVVAPGSPRGMAGALSVLIQAPQLREKVGRRNAQAALRYGWNIVGQEIVSVYERKLGSKE